jgi:endonuclease VIII
MPEGDTLFRIAANLTPALVGQPVIAVEIRKIPCERLVGHRVTQVEARGKNLLVFFDEGTVIHTHLRMGGAWHLYRPGERWRRSPGSATVIIANASVAAVCFRAPVVRLLRASALRNDPMISALGPDLLGDVFDEAAALARLRALGGLPLGEAVMDQHVIAGIGNVYKSEVLFHEKLDPFAPVSAFSDDEILRLLAFSRRIMVANVKPPSRAPGTPTAHYRYTRTTRENRWRGEGPVAVYRRARSPCYDCTDLIRMKRQGEQLRSTYFCPTCQPSRAGRASEQRTQA